MDLHVPSAWARSADSLLRRRWGRILVLGAVGRGKAVTAPFSASVSWRPAAWRLWWTRMWGQKDIGPPACITLGYLEPGRPLAALAPAAFYFVGAVSPRGHLLPMLVVARRLLVRREPSAPCSGAISAWMPRAASWSGRAHPLMSSAQGPTAARRAGLHHLSAGGCHVR
ncbi:MAG: hypothetical protein AB1790_09550 [Pseudomonadota bacterium]